MSIRERAGPVTSDLLCFSHLRWGWVYQRPQHLLTRAARNRRVHFFEEPIAGEGPPTLEIEHRDDVSVLRPRIAPGLSAESQIAVQRALVDAYIYEHSLRAQTLWYYTPMALPFTHHLSATVRVFDCMDELSAFAGAPPALRLLEKQLLSQMDVVFTGGWSLYEAKSGLHANCHAMPSSVDVKHFSQARTIRTGLAARSAADRPIVGFCGVIDERLDLPLIDALADARPDLELVFVGPVTKIDEGTLPRRDNIQWLGPCDYADLPRAMAPWDVAWMPFAMNESTRYISPTKTPEYLAAGLPVVSTPVRDVVRSWGAEKLVHIASDAAECAAAIDVCLQGEDTTWLTRVDRTLAQQSWDITWQRMEDVMVRSASAAA